VGALAQSLAKRRALRTGLDVATATDVLYTIGGPETFRQLVRERGWTPTHYEEWLVEAGRRLLLTSRAFGESNESSSVDKNRSF
jgi:hypothetical protein